jgi:hypothetical protein
VETFDALLLILTSIRADPADEIAEEREARAAKIHLYLPFGLLIQCKLNISYKILLHIQRELQILSYI